MTDRSDTDILELRRIIAGDPAHAGAPDLALLVGAGRRRLARRRAILGGTALGAAAAVVVPTLLLAGGPGDSARDPDRRDFAASPSPPPRASTANDLDCGVLSCVDPDGPGATLETGTLVGEPLVVAPLPGGGEELVYVVSTKGVDLATHEEGMVDVLKAGYRVEGRLYSTLWSLQPGYDSGPHRFWYNAGLLDAPEGTGDRYVVVGYVEGTPEEITWTTPDGDAGPVDGLQVVDGYTIFYLTRPLPDDYEPARFKRDKDGSVTIDKMIGDHAVFSPDLTIHTSDGWSCSLEDCGSTG